VLERTKGGKYKKVISYVFQACRLAQMEQEQMHK
jgi:hypothetical protein